MLSKIAAISLIFIFILLPKSNQKLVHKVVEHDPYHHHDCPSLLGCYNSSSPLANFSKAIIATDGHGCAKIGKELLLKGGSAVDASIGVLLCMGVVIPESMGIGGGCMMVIYDEKTQESLEINGREHAPAAAYKDMFQGNATMANTGGLSIAVPGELYAYHEAHIRYGRLEWKELFKGAIEVAENGFQVGKQLSLAMREKSEVILERPGLKNIFWNQETNELFEEGEIMRRPDLAKTLHHLSLNGIKSFYSGALMKQMVQTIQAAGGIITEQDFKSYRPRVQDPLKINLRDGTHILITPRPPGSGVLLGFILNLMSGYDDLYPFKGKANLENAALYYHRQLESMRFAFAKRHRMADERFEDIKELVKNLTSHDFSDLIRNQINDSYTTDDPSYYGFDEDVGIGVDDHGTAHMTVYDENGLAVSITSTVNLFFGSKVIDVESGVIFNNQMDDFSSPNISNSFGLPPSELYNFIEPGKIPMSSMCPSIFARKENGNVELVIGAEGGSHIITSLSQTIVRVLYFDDSIKTGIDAPRLHEQLFPNTTLYENNFPEDLLDELREKGHRFEKLEHRQSEVTGLHIADDGLKYGNTDYSKGGSVDGY